jgi:hypothetical protein
VPCIDMEVNAVGDGLVLSATEYFEGSDSISDVLEANRENFAFDAPVVIVFEGLQNFLVEWVSISWFEDLEAYS